MTNQQIIWATIATWAFKIIAWLIKLIPLLQSVSLILAIIVSVITIYKWLETKFFKKDEEDI